MSFSISLDQSWFVRGVQTHSPGNAPTGTVNNNIQVTVYPDWYNQISLDWKVPTGWGNCSFHVYFAPTVNGDYQRLTSAPLSTPSLTDTRDHEYSKFRHGYYIVEALIEGRNLRVRSEPTTWSHKRRTFIEKRASEIQRREYILLSKFAGVKAYVFRRRNYGLRCTRCWNKETEKVMDDHCPVCYGVSFEGGYFDPIPTFIQFEPTPNSVVKTYFGDLEPNQIGAWTISLPEITSDDVIIRTGDWAVYQVIRVATTELQTNTVRQMMTLTQLSRGDVENALSKRAETVNSEQYVSLIGGRYAKQRFDLKDLDSNPNNDHKWFKEQNVQSLPKKYTI